MWHTKHWSSYCLICSEDLAISLRILSMSAFEMSILLEDSFISFLILSLSAFETSILLEDRKLEFTFWNLNSAVMWNFRHQVWTMCCIRLSHTSNLLCPWFLLFTKLLSFQSQMQWSQLPMHLRDRQLCYYCLSSNRMLLLISIYWNWSILYK